MQEISADSRAKDATTAVLRGELQALKGRGSNPLAEADREDSTRCAKVSDEGRQEGRACAVELSEEAEEVGAAALNMQKATPPPPILVTALGKRGPSRGEEEPPPRSTRPCNPPRRSGSGVVDLWNHNPFTAAIAAQVPELGIVLPYSERVEAKGEGGAAGPNLPESCRQCREVARPREARRLPSRAPFLQRRAGHGLDVLSPMIF